MRRKPDPFLWIAFAAVCSLSYAIDQWFWRTPGDHIWLIGLGFLAWFLAGLILGRRGRDWKAITFVVLGLIAGQLWALQTAASYLAWAIRGLLP